jgi:hypothetical protein
MTKHKILLKSNKKGHLFEVSVGIYELTFVIYFNS